MVRPERVAPSSAPEPSPAVLEDLVARFDDPELTVFDRKRRNAVSFAVGLGETAVRQTTVEGLRPAAVRLDRRRAVP